MADPLADLRAAAAKLAEQPAFMCSINVSPDLRLLVLRHPEVMRRRVTMQLPPPYPPNPFWGVPVYEDDTLPPRTWQAIDQNGNTYATGVVAESPEETPDA